MYSIMLQFDVETKRCYLIEDKNKGGSYQNKPGSVHQQPRSDSWAAPPERQPCPDPETDIRTRPEFVPKVREEVRWPGASSWWRWAPPRRASRESPWGPWCFRRWSRRICTAGWPSASGGTPSGTRNLYSSWLCLEIDNFINNLNVGLKKNTTLIRYKSYLPTTSCKAFILLTEDETDGLVDRGLVREMRFQKLGRQKVAEVSWLVPANMEVINVDHSKPAHHVQLETRKNAESCYLTYVFSARPDRRKDKFKCYKSSTN